MICPVCNIDMLIMEYEGVEVDLCSSCDGIWFDSGELEILFINAGLPTEEFNWDQLLKPVEKNIKEKQRRCSICNTTMEKVVLGSRPGVIIDRCVKGHGFWFDGGELRNALQEFTEDESAVVNNILEFLGEALTDDGEREGDAS